MNQQRLEVVLAEEIVEHQNCKTVNSALDSEPPSIDGATAAFDSEVSCTVEDGSATVAALPSPSADPPVVLDLTSNHSRTASDKICTKLSIDNQVPISSSVLPTPSVSSKKSTSNNGQICCTASLLPTFGNNSNSNKGVVNVTSSNSIINSTSASTISHTSKSVDLADGLITIDTSSLSTTETAPLTSIDIRHEGTKTYKVTAQGTIVPPLGSAFPDGSLQTDVLVPFSYSSISTAPTISPALVTKVSTSAATNRLPAPELMNILASSKDENKSTISNCHLQSADSRKVPLALMNNCNPQNGHENDPIITVSVPNTNNDSSLSVSSASIGELPIIARDSSGVVSAAGAEVRGMLANPVLAPPNKPKASPTSAPADSRDGGRLTFFRGL